MNRTLGAFVGGMLGAILIAITIGGVLPTEAKGTQHHCHLYSGSGMECDHICEGFDICCGVASDCWS